MAGCEGGPDWHTLTVSLKVQRDAGGPCVYDAVMIIKDVLVKDSEVIVPPESIRDLAGELKRNLSKMKRMIRSDDADAFAIQLRISDGISNASVWVCSTKKHLLGRKSSAKDLTGSIRIVSVQRMLANSIFVLCKMALTGLPYTASEK